MKAEDLERMNIERRRAYHRVGLAVESGELEKPDKCARCGYEADLEAHHPNYARPLDVIFLCRKCHAIEHRDIRKALYRAEKAGAPA